MFVHRFNATNADEPSFVLDNIDQIRSRLARDKDSAVIVVYAVNQKGRSAGVIIRDLELGSSASTGSDGNYPPPTLAAVMKSCQVHFLFDRNANCRRNTRLHAVLHRNRDNHPRRVHFYCIQNAVHLLGG